MSSRPCKLCNRELIFARTITGKMIPLDAKATVYRVIPESGDAVVAVGYYTSHFFTCRFANEFSGSKKKESES